MVSRIVIPSADRFALGQTPEPEPEPTFAEAWATAIGISDLSRKVDGLSLGVAAVERSLVKQSVALDAAMLRNAELEDEIYRGAELVERGDWHHEHGYQIGSFPTGMLDSYKAWWRDRPWQALGVHAGLMLMGYAASELFGYQSRAAMVADAAAKGAARAYDNRSRLNPWPVESEWSEDRIRGLIGETQKPQRIIQESRTIEKTVRPVIEKIYETRNVHQRTIKTEVKTQVKTQVRAPKQAEFEKMLFECEDRNPGWFRKHVAPEVKYLEKANCTADSIRARLKAGK